MTTTWPDLAAPGEHPAHVLLGAHGTGQPARPLVEPAGAEALRAYRALRREVFVAEQGLFTGHDRDDTDDDPRAVVLVARAADGTVVGGVRLAPATADTDLGWWTGSRLAVHHTARHRAGIGSALVRAACAYAENAGVLRFEATVQARNEPLFGRLGWQRVRPVRVAQTPHVLMRWPTGGSPRWSRLPRRRSDHCWLGCISVARDSSVTTAFRSPGPTWCWPATRCNRPWSNATPNGLAGAGFSSTSTTSPPWGPLPSACSTPSEPATRRSRRACSAGSGRRAPRTACRSSAGTRRCPRPRRWRSPPWAARAPRSQAVAAGPVMASP